MGSGGWNSMIVKIRIGVVIGALALGGCGPEAQIARAEKALAGKPLSFATDIQPIVTARCQRCHVDEARGDFSMATLKRTMAGGKSGAVVLPGNADQSRLFLLVADRDPGKKIMPPKGDPLTPMQIATIKVWINGGAK